MDDIKFKDILEADENLKEKIRQWRNKEDIRKFMINQEIISEDEHKKWLEKLKEDDRIKFWIVYFKELPIGIVNLQNIDHKNLTSEWGFHIGEQSYRGIGLSKKILYKLLQIFFNEMKFNILYTKVLSCNKTAINLYKKYRFREKGDITEENKPIKLMVFTKGDWIKWKEVLKNEYITSNK